MQKIIFSLFTLAFVFLPFAETPKATANQTAIEWLSFEQAVQKSLTEQRKVLVDVYTDWCGWCKKMDKETFNHPEVTRYLNQKYYAVKLNAETRETIKVGDMTFKYVENGRSGINELAVTLLDGKMSYPSIVFLDESFNKIQALPGYRDAKTLDQILHFFGQNAHKQGTSWENFLKTYQSPIN